MVYYGITVRKLRTKCPLMEDYTDWLANAARLTLVPLAKTFEFGNDNVLHLHGIFFLKKNIFWNRLRGSPYQYHIDVRRLQSSADYDRFFKYIHKKHFSEDYVKHRSVELWWRDQDYAFVEEGV